MGNFALNHMTTAKVSFAELLCIAQSCGCSGVELRNDLECELLDGLDPQLAAEMVSSKGLQIYALAEVKAFNHMTAQTVADTEKLAKFSQSCGCEAIALIPANDGSRTDAATRKKDLRFALKELLPVLDQYNILGFVEPLGFASASLRSKREVVEAIEETGASERFKLVHDTFHHVLAGEPEYYPAHTGMVHISGVTDAEVSVVQMKDSHRVLVNSDDRLQTTAQLAALTKGGYVGPVSMEAFAPEVHNFLNPVEYLRDSFQFISSGLAARVA